MFQDLRRNQRRIAELNSTIRKLEDRNSLLVDERNELVWQNEFSSFMFRYFAFRLNWASPLLLTSWSAFEKQRSNVNPCWTRTKCWIKGMTIWLRLSRRWRRNSKAWQRRTLRWSARRCARITCLSVFWTTGWCCGHFSLWVCCRRRRSALIRRSRNWSLWMTWIRRTTNRK